MSILRRDDLRSRARLVVALCLGLAAAVLSCAPASALVCSFGISNVNFGSVNGLLGASVDTTATLSVSCTAGVPSSIVRICPNIGAGSGGASATARQVVNGSAALNYQLYQDASRSVVWGSIFASGAPPTVDLPLNLSGSGSTTRTIYARLFLPAAPTAGLYQSAFSGTETGFFYAPLLNIGGCDGITVLAPTDRPTFNVASTITPNCRVSTQDLDFGSTGTLAANRDATGAVAVTCTQGTGYTVALGSGNANASPTARKLSNGSAQILYGLYRDAARTQPWGDALGSTASGIATVPAQPLTVYGRVPPQAIPQVGTYTDTIVVTVTY